MYAPPDEFIDVEADVTDLAVYGDFDQSNYGGDYSSDVKEGQPLIALLPGTVVGGVSLTPGLHSTPQIAISHNNSGSISHQGINNSMNINSSSSVGGNNNSSNYANNSTNAAGGQAEYAVPDLVRNFLVFFNRALKEAKTASEIQQIYDSGFNRLTERFYKQAPWPAAELIAPFVDNDQLFMMLYKELYYRHIYSQLTPTLEQRFESFENYADLFDFLIHSEQPVNIDLPSQWLWDMIDEFIYQYQAFCHYRSKLKGKSSEELAALSNNTAKWDTHTVLNILNLLIEKSRINQQLEYIHVHNVKPEEVPVDVAGMYGSRSLYRMLGYFSVIGLCRFHCLIGDYYSALRAMDNIELNRRGLYSRVPACQITTYYYVGFAYLMLRRYQDAVRTFANILLFIHRTKQYHQRSTYQFEQMTKRSEQMYALLAIAVTVCPQHLDENLRNILKEKCGEKIFKLQKGDEATFEELFNYACPKFISPVPPPLDSQPGNYIIEGYKLQQKLFITEMKQQVIFPNIRSYLKLYTTMPVSKLASFLEVDETTCRSLLLSYKHKTRSLVWSQGPPISGSMFSSSDIDFYLDKDMIHVADTKFARRYGEFFARQIVKFNELNK